MTSSRTKGLTAPERGIEIVASQSRPPPSMNMLRWRRTRIVLVSSECLMALDRPDDDFEAGEARLEQHLRNCGASGETPAVRSEPAESRTREEYYEALRAADDNLAEDAHAADSRTDHSSWDTVDAANRPPVEAIRVSPERTHAHTRRRADGGGGHRHGIGKPGKTEFPASWDDKKIMTTSFDVARRPDDPPVHQDWNDRWVCTRDPGQRRSLSDRASHAGKIWTGWPEAGSPGVVTQPQERSNHDGNSRSRSERRTLPRYGSLIA